MARTDYTIEWFSRNSRQRVSILLKWPASPGSMTLDLAILIDYKMVLGCGKCIKAILLSCNMYLEHPTLQSRHETGPKKKKHQADKNEETHETTYSNNNYGQANCVIYKFP